MNTDTHISLRKRAVALAAALALGAGLSLTAVAEEEISKADEWQGEAHDAWIDGKIEVSYTLNRYLNPFAIDTEVENGVVTLTGEVDSQIDKDLAEEIAKGTEGVTEVRNELVVEAGTRDANERQYDDHRDFGDFVDDATITARVKYALIENDSTEGLSIDVDTRNGTVTLSGEVDNAQEKQLAEQVAGNVEGVEEVTSKLTVAGQT